MKRMCYPAIARYQVSSFFPGVESPRELGQPGSLDQEVAATGVCPVDKRISTRRVPLDDPNSHIRCKARHKLQLHHLAGTVHVQSALAFYLALSRRLQ
ncbi:hypothetical protein PAXRUDRAFT_823449 [Paxillus rubicundulus Ve08.2h10]|uniref:Uncharacterized protein n=1 Tax=Paxillus rubicundulus Ve08.2h10 TaxID=930991 RepID=A0A0D0DK25_9AGAM|nr:hypothetical protein PAXRUDRAFT_823449 [Paxillus rubicundulus Ve08.2h10]